ncbi:unnamed protein product [Linum tenue]|uniref:Uncharacterized protein n=1 Tax=Linum tenue TaxID=586396 RepID=A0AAV0KKB0_9ROSI|nr:unnamed protein product [Linum tenue]
MYSGDKKHVLAGIAVISVIFGIPWYLMNRGLIQFYTLSSAYSFIRREGSNL